MVFSKYRGDHTSEVPIIVFIPGFLGIEPYEQQSLHRILKARGLPHRLIVLSPSPVGSAHDRACQAFYELKGGRTFFGEQHSEYHGHDAYGEDNEGLFPQWDHKAPVHLVGHSFGGITARVLLEYLAQRRFPNHETSACWVSSITTVSTPHRGALNVYPLGMSSTLPPIIGWLSPGFVIGCAMQYLECLGFTKLTKLAHFRQTYSTLLHSLMGISSLYGGTDCAAYDMTLQSQSRWKDALTMSSHVHYYSFVCRNKWGSCPTRPLPFAIFHNLVYIGVQTFQTLYGVPHNLKDKFNIPSAFASTQGDGILFDFEQVPHDATALQGLGSGLGSWNVQELESDHLGVLYSDDFANKCIDNILSAHKRRVKQSHVCNTCKLLSHSSADMQPRQTFTDKQKNTHVPFALRLLFTCVYGLVVLWNLVDASGARQYQLMWVYLSICTMVHLFDSRKESVGTVIRMTAIVGRVCGLFGLGFLPVLHQVHVAWMWWEVCSCLAIEVHGLGLAWYVTAICRSILAALSTLALAGSDSSNGVLDLLLCADLSYVLTSLSSLFTTNREKIWKKLPWNSSCWFCVWMLLLSNEAAALTRLTLLPTVVPYLTAENADTYIRVALFLCLSVGTLTKANLLSQSHQAAITKHNGPVTVEGSKLRSPDTYEKYNRTTCTSNIIKTITLT